MTIVELDHVQVAAPRGCEDAAREFYGVLLGLDEIAKPPLLASRGGVWFAVGRQELHVGVVADFAAATKAHPGLRVEDEAGLHDLAERLERAGHHVAWADPDELPGRRRFHVADPWGNRIELRA